MILLPGFDWFINTAEGKPVTNPYTGSCGTNPETGCFNATTFHYKVSVQNRGEAGECFFCECFLETTWSRGVRRCDISTMTYAASLEGLKSAEAWVNEEWRKFKENKEE